jgi:uncharacterized RDD family membrane protein YckC
MPHSHAVSPSPAIRVLAYILDLGAVSVLFVLLVMAVQPLRLDFGNSLWFAVVFFVYHATFLLWSDGMSFGKRLRRLCVVTLDGQSAAASQALLRAVMLSLPFFGVAFYEAPLTVDSELQAAAMLLVCLLGTVVALADFALVVLSPAHVTLTDRISRTRVYYLPPIQPYRAPAGPMFSTNDAEFGVPPKQTPKPK